MEEDIYTTPAILAKVQQDREGAADLLFLRWT